MKERKKQAGSSSPFWKPENEGDTLEGKFTHYSKGMENDDGSYGVNIGVGGKLVPMSLNVRNALMPLIKAGKMKAGKTTVKFVFIEKKKLPKGRHVNVLEVFADGKQLETGNFPKLTDDEALMLLDAMPEPKAGKKKK